MCGDWTAAMTGAVRNGGTMFLYGAMNGVDFKGGWSCAAAHVQWEEAWPLLGL